MNRLETPREVFFKPKTEFVASFVGAENRFRVYVSSLDFRNGLAKVQTDDLEFIVPMEKGLRLGEQICLFIRPDDISLVPEQTKGFNVFSGIVKDSFFMGGIIRAKISIGSHYLIVDVPRAIASEYGLRPGKVVHLSIKPNIVICIRRDICTCRIP